MEKDKLDGTTIVSTKGIFTNTTEDQKALSAIEEVISNYSEKKKKSNWLSIGILTYVVFRLILSVEKVGRNNPDMLKTPSFWITITTIGIAVYLLYSKFKKRF